MNDTFSSETGSAVYCAGCNGCFLRADVEGHCPQCGGTVHSLLDTDGPLSQLIRNVPVAAERAKKVHSDDDIDRRIGTRLHVYQLESLIGRGGMGRVYLARHADLHRMCALKILSPKLSAIDADYVMRFEHEGRAAAALNHPNIVTIHAIGEAEGFHFLEMEFVPGRSLQQLIMDEGQLTPERSTVLATGIADGLAAAHREGILHRDLKPDNVLMTNRGVPKIGDFGLAKRIAAPSQTTEKLVGTPHFMAPELFHGEPASSASDVYALGICYFVMLTGRFPFVRGSLSQLKQAVANEPLPNVRDLCEDVSLEMAECLSLLLAKSPANRPAGGIEALQLLHAVLGDFRDIDSLLQEAFLNSNSVTWRQRKGVYRLEVVLPDGRRQSIFIEGSKHSPANRLLMLYSVCCPADAAYYEYALKLNSEIPHGGLAIREIDGKLMFVVVDTYPRATVDPEEIRKSALELAYRADAVEELLTGFDVH